MTDRIAGIADVRAGRTIPFGRKRCAMARLEWSERALSDLDTLIKEARERRRRVRTAFAALVVLVAGGAAFAARDGVGLAARRCPSAANLGTVAFTRAGALEIVDLRTCRTRVLVRARASGPVHFSADGRYVAFGGGYVPTRGGNVRRTPSGTASWSPRADLLAVASKGGLELIAPGRTMRRLLPRGWGGAGTPLFSPDGRTIAVTRLARERPFPKPISGRLITPEGVEIWLVDVATGDTRMLSPRRRSMQPFLAGFSPDGRWLLYQEYPDAASLAADGMMLAAVPVAGGRPVEIARVLGDDFAWCGGKLVYAIDHGGRIASDGDGIAVAAAPSWRSRTILPAGGKTSWGSVACPSAAAAAKGGGGLVVTGGPSSDDSPFGREHRSLWLVSPTPGARPQQLHLTVPPKGETDELPMWSGDGRWILYVRTKPGGISARGALYALDPFGGNVVGPFTGIGSTQNYYGSYNWPGQLDWHR